MNRPDDIPAASEPQSELERLREEVAFLKSCGIVELAVRNPSVAEYMSHWEGRAERAEAEVESLRPVVERLDQLGLVIEAGVRWSDPGNLPPVKELLHMPALKAAAKRRRDAIRTVSRRD